MPAQPVSRRAIPARIYFSGIRPVIVNEAAPRPVRFNRRPPGAEIAATRMMRIGAHQQSEPGLAPQFIGARKVPQWVFLGHLFERVLLQDRLAMGASGASTKTSTLRRALLMFASLVLPGASR